MNILLIAGSILVIAILFFIYRIITLLSVAKGKDTKKIETTGNKINGFLFLIFLLVAFTSLIWYSYTRFDIYNLPLASEHGAATDMLFWVTMAVTGFVFIITHILLFTFPFRYYYRKERKALFYPDNHKLELAWTIIPAIVLAILIFSGLKVWSDITKAAPQDAEVVEIMGHQFAWKLRYPGYDGKLGNYNYQLTAFDNPMGVDFSDENAFDDFSPGQMYLPKGKNVLFKIRARDVLHSVFAPHFRLKMDAVPGMPTSFWFKPTKTTEEMRKETGNPDFNYEIACTEICGEGHFSMRLLVFVVEPDEYEKWKDEQESMLQRNPDLLRFVSQNLKETALVKSGLKPDNNKEEKNKGSQEINSSM